jgi:hypothetical protein
MSETIIFWRCERCGEEFSKYTFSHSRAEMGPDGQPIEVQCGPVEKIEMDALRGEEAR